MKGGKERKKKGGWRKIYGRREAKEGGREKNRRREEKRREKKKREEKRREGEREEREKRENLETLNCDQRE